MSLLLQFTHYNTQLLTYIDKVNTMTNTSTQAYEIKEKLATLEAQLKETTPNIATLLRDIHTKLKNDPDTVTILTADECATLVRGLKHQTGTVIAVKAAKKAPKKALSKITADDL